MDAQSRTSWEEPLSDSLMLVEATCMLNPLDAVMKEMADLQQVNEKVNKWSDNVLHLKATKERFQEKKGHTCQP